MSLIPHLLCTRVLGKSCQFSTRDWWCSCDVSRWNKEIVTRLTDGVKEALKVTDHLRVRSFSFFVDDSIVEGFSWLISRGVDISDHNTSYTQCLRSSVVHSSI